MSAITVTQDRQILEIGFVVKDLLKVIKVVSTYPENNPLPQSLKQSFSERLVTVVRTYGGLEFEVDRGTIRFRQEIVYEDRSREERLAGVFYEAGITGFAFLDGLDTDEVYRLLAAIRTYLNSPGREQDLAALFWEQGLSRFTFQTLHDVALGDYDESFQIQEHHPGQQQHRQGQAVFGYEGNQAYDAIFTGDPSTPDTGKVYSGTVSLDGSGSSSGGVPSSFAEPAGDPGISDSLEEFLAEAAPFLNVDSSLPSEPPAAAAPPEPNTPLILNREFRATEEDEQTVRELLHEDAEFDPCESTLEIVKELLLQELDMNAFYETVTIAEKVLGDFVSEARLFEAARLLLHLQELDARIRPEKPLWAERLKDAFTTAGSRDRLAALSAALNKHPEVGVAEIKKYLDCFGWEAFGTITDLLGEFEHDLHRGALKDYLTARGNSNLEIISKGIFDKRPHVVRNAVSILGQLTDPRSLKYLERVIDHNDLEIRQELVAALTASPFVEALQLLKRLIDDPDAAIRKAAVEAIVKRRGSEAFQVIGDVISTAGFPALLPEEQQSLLNAYSILGGDEAVPYLSRLITRYNFLNDTTLAMYRTAALEAMCHNPGERAQRTLIRLSSSWRPDLRRQATAAIGRRRQVIYGS